MSEIIAFLKENAKVELISKIVQKENNEPLWRPARVVLSRM